MKTLPRLIFFVSVILVSSFFFTSCQKNKYPAFLIDQILVYAKPEGGINLYDFSNKQRYSISIGKDYYPSLTKDGKTVFFVRIIEKDSSKQFQSNQDQKIPSNLSHKTERWAEIFSKNLSSKSEKRISKVSLYDPGTNPKDYVRFVDNHSKMIIFSNYYPIQIFEVSSGKLLNIDPSVFFEECNVITNQQTIFVHVRQIPKMDFLGSVDHLIMPEYQDSLFEATTDGILKQIRKIPKDQMYKQSFFGFTFFDLEKKLIYSFNHKLYMRESNGNETIMFPGVHPFCNGNLTKKLEHYQFPWFQCSFIIQDDNKVLIGEQNRLAMLEKKKKKLTLFTKDLFQISNLIKDPHYLFDHLEWLSLTKNDSSVLLISSKKKDDSIGPERIVDLGKKPDLVLLFSWQIDSVLKKFEMNEKRDFTITFKDLNLDNQLEIMAQYSASNFICEERFQAAGRSLIWIDVFQINKEGIYQQMNQNYPAIYSDLLSRLNPYYQRALTASRLKEPILCKDDIEKLEMLIREAEITINTKQ